MNDRSVSLIEIYGFERTIVCHFEASTPMRVPAPTYRIELSHPQLGRHRVITGKDPRVVRLKAAEQESQWEAQWLRKCEAELKRLEREAKQPRAENGLEEARLQTEEAEQEIAELNGILAHTLDVDDRIDWNALYDHREFGRPPVTPPIYESFPPEPEPRQFAPEFGLLDKVWSTGRAKKEKAAEKAFRLALEEWNRKVAQIEHQNLENRARHDRDVASHGAEREAFYAERDRRNQAIEKEAKAYFDGDPSAVSEYCDLVLSRSEYPAYFPKEWELAFNAATGMLVIDYQLPSKDAMPTRKGVKYIKSRDEFKVSTHSAAFTNALYDSVLYQVCIRTIHEVLEADAVGAISGVVYNGIVTSIDPSTGNPVTACIMSVQVSKAEFLEINLARVEPKECFKKLKGVGSSKLHGLAPVPPLAKLDKEDSRFVEAYSVVDDIDSSSNLASMDWEDFEHLIREVFEAEFASSDGEVKVTRASRDGGVDAIAFDPDPIRGGKIVIQAKRYTGTVGVSAIRDLYGTVVNEGATKGILVTTSDYGPDAYKFAREKPLSLLNGANLLHLLEKHGRRARIDLAEAREQLP